VTLPRSRLNYFSFCHGWVEEISSNKAELRRRVEGTFRFECRSPAGPILLDDLWLSFVGASAMAW
jgi:hypothetical protein